MSNLEELIQEYCPNGVEMIELFKIAKIVRGDRITKKDIVEDGAFPVISGGQMPMGRYGKYNREASTITISSYGAAGYIGFQLEKFWANDVCLCVFPSEKVENKYLYYALKTKQNYLYSKTTKAIPDHIPTTVLQELKIPLPALPVQREIVRILDSFTLYSAELTAELTARRKQYEFYRDKLLTFSQNDFEWTILEKIAVYTNGKGHENNVNEKGKYILINSKFISTKGEVIKFVDEQFSPIYQNEFAMVLSDLPNGRALAKCFFVLEDDRYTVNQRICRISNINEKILPKFLFYYMDRNKYFLAKDNGVDQTNLSKDYVLQMPIPVLPLAFQKRIVYVLDNFDEICSDLKIGLPAEMEKRQQQYEYYREKLLTFDTKSATIFRQTDRQTGLIRLLQYVYGVVNVRLGDIAEYSTNRIGASKVDRNNYVGVDNLLADRKGKTQSVYVPENGNLTAFYCKNTLIGNIRPYLKKIWFANCDGGTNGDVLVIKPNENFVEAKYLYYVLASDRFFAFDMQYAKGAKMPRGNKEEIMTYQFPLPPLEKQKEIVEILDRFDNLCNDISEGLPAEIEARQKQYEYYRDKLLNFKDIEEDGEKETKAKGTGKN